MENNQNTEEIKKSKKILQFIKFACFSVSAGVIQVVSFTLMNEVLVKLPLIQNAINSNDTFARIMANEYGPMYLIALILSVVWNFTFNRKFTFKSAANIPVAMLKVFGYYCVFTPLSVMWGNALTARFASVAIIEYIVLGGTMAINMITEFLFYKYVVFKGQEGTAVKEEETEEETEE